ncbi:MAG: sulfur oxidation c-type cytochrome SoxX, partial [Betaproteobacteria bacterium]|nr:sulfur oxidation c-type cytochrome SoxX [Betaproteobacteria bacterium]
HGDNPPAEVAKAIEEAQFKVIPFPAGSLVGDWRRGQRIAESGRGMQWNDKPGDAAGGSCYNCHQISREQESHGTLGPTLLAFGKLRGNTAEIQRYAYGKIYNSKAYNACSQMPRMGSSGTLTEQQIKDLVAYLVDPASPVNK